MVTAYVLRLVSAQPVPLDFFSGFAVRGLFFRFLKSFDSMLADEVHDARTLSPYSVSPVETLAGRGIFYGVIQPGFVFQMRMNALNGVVGDALMKSLLSVDASRLELNGVEVWMREVAVKNWAPLEKVDVYEGVRFSVRFRSPTFFRSTQKGPTFLMKLLPRRLRKPVRPVYRYMILPDPYLFFRTLARLYRQFGEPSFPYKSYSEWLLEGGVALETYSRLRVSKVYDDRGRWSRGFMGHVVFTIPRDLFDRRMASITVNLLEFAKFSNVGGNRTAGFGVVDYRVYPPRDGGEE